jgi:phenylpyruvate tautomerase PptA (4-oxalocrotonate tautomerase family)
MPTYNVFTPLNQLNQIQKSKLAKEITRCHTDVTGAQTFFVQVIFNEINLNNWFMGGSTLGSDPTIFLFGHIRGGRPDEMKYNLMNRMRDVLIQQTNIASNRTWVYVVELPPALMLEYGHILPEPGEEATWLANMPAQDRYMLETMSKLASIQT